MASKARKRLNKVLNRANALTRDGLRDLRAQGVNTARKSLRAGVRDLARSQAMKETGVPDLRAMIRTFGDPALSTRCEELQQSEDLAFLQLMRRVCLAANGQGLAAPQIGILKRAIFVRPGGVGYGEFMLNPVILDKSIETVISQGEGCLSYPGVRTDILRAAAVKVWYLSATWSPVMRTLTGVDAIVAQHEIDHLDGVCRVGDAWRRRGGRILGGSVLDTVLAAVV